MPRLRYIEESEKSPHTRELIESAKRTGAPDPRVVSLMTRSPLGIAWVEYWNKLLYQGVLPHKLKEMCRIKISVAHPMRLLLDGTLERRKGRRADREHDQRPVRSQRQHALQCA